MAVRRGAEDAFNQVVKDAIVVVFLLDEGQALVLPLHRATDGALELLRGVFLACKEILRAGGDGFHGELCVGGRAEDDDGDARCLD